MSSGCAPFDWGGKHFPISRFHQERLGWGGDSHTHGGIAGERLSRAVVLFPSLFPAHVQVPEIMGAWSCFNSH